MTGYIYLIRNSVNGKGYIGQTVTGVSRRFGEHKATSRIGSTLALHRAMRKHGFHNFSILEIASCGSKELLNELEQHYIKFFGTYSVTGHGYNMTLGGDSSHGYVMSPESRAKMSLAKKGKPLSEEHKAKIGLAGRNRPRRERTPKPPKIRLTTIGKKLSEEHKAKLSAAKKGKAPWNKGKGLPKTIQPRRDRVVSEETRTKISAANRGRGKGKPWTEARRNAQRKRAT
jgi:group I intron endonuclease